MAEVQRGAALGRARSWAIVDLGALTENLTRVRDVTGVPVICVVKADAYGHGAVPVAEALSRVGAEMLAVACVNEAAEITGAGIQTPILLLGEASSEEISEGIHMGLQFSVYTPDFLRELASEAEVLRRRAPIHIKVDTGMHRLGTDPKTALGLLERALGMEGVEVAGLWTHMAVADDPSDEFTETQIARFREFLQRAGAILGNRPIRGRLLVHAANSAAAIAFPQARFDAVRVGICLYGIKPSPNFPLPEGLRLRPVLTWKSRVSLVREVCRGARPSYGRTRAVEGTRLAVVPVGYADGYMRALSNEADVLIRGRRHRIAGSVTMDHVIVECAPGGRREDDVRPGDEVVLIGSQGTGEISAEELASKAGTIAYEVLTRIGPRVRRVFVSHRNSGNRL